MCTLSIFPSHSNLIITMNRDEQRHRDEQGNLSLDVHGCYPVDVQSNGTWVGASQYGFVFALLNRYQDQHINNASKVSTQSRGTLIPALLSCQSFQDIRDKVNALALSHYNPFDLVCVSSDQVLRITWKGRDAEFDPFDCKTPFFLTSSSERADLILPYRRNVFEIFVKTNTFDDLNTRDYAQTVMNDLHLYQDKDDLSASILMSRPAVCTKSIVQMIVSTAQTDISYWSNLGGEHVRNLSDYIASSLKHVSDLSPQSQIHHAA